MDHIRLTGKQLNPSGTLTKAHHAHRTLDGTSHCKQSHIKAHKRYRSVNTRFQLDATKLVSWCPVVHKWPGQNIQSFNGATVSGAASCWFKPQRAITDPVICHSLQ